MEPLLTGPAGFPLGDVLGLIENKTTTLTYYRRFVCAFNSFAYPKLCVALRRLKKPVYYWLTSFYTQMRVIKHTVKPKDSVPYPNATVISCHRLPYSITLQVQWLRPLHLTLTSTFNKQRTSIKNILFCLLVGYIFARLGINLATVNKQYIVAVLVQCLHTYLIPNVYNAELPKLKYEFKQYNT